MYRKYDVQVPPLNLKFIQVHGIINGTKWMDAKWRQQSHCYAHSTPRERTEPFAAVPDLNIFIPPLSASMTPIRRIRCVFPFCVLYEEVQKNL